MRQIKERIRERGIAGWYAEFVAEERVFFFAVLMVVSLGLAFQAMNVGIVNFDYKTILPPDGRTMSGVNFAEDNFMSTEEVGILVYKSQGSSEIDLRDHEYVRYADEIGRTVGMLPFVEKVQSPATVLKMKNNDSIEISRADYIEMLDEDVVREPLNPLEYADGYVDKFGELSSGLDEQYEAIDALTSANADALEAIREIKAGVQKMKDETDAIYATDVSSGPAELKGGVLELKDGVEQSSAGVKALGSAMNDTYCNTGSPYYDATTCAVYTSSFAGQFSYITGMMDSQIVPGFDSVAAGVDDTSAGLSSFKEQMIAVNEGIAQVLFYLDALEAGISEFNDNMVILKGATYDIKSNVSVFNEQVQDIYSLASGFADAEYDAQKYRLDNSKEFAPFYSSDASAFRIQVIVGKGADAKVVTGMIKDIAMSVERPPNVEVAFIGTMFESEKLQSMVPEAMGKSSIFASVFIMLILLYMIRKPALSVFTLSSVLFGTLWTFGTLGIIGMDLNAASSGALSILLGIGIDFGIQIISEFLEHHEREGKGLSEALESTFKITFRPIMITTISALIGFFAMGLGQITIMKDMSEILMMGIVLCFVAAFTVLPCLIAMYVMIKKKIKGDFDEEEQ